MRFGNVRPLGWLIISVNVYMFYWLITGVGDLADDATAVGIFFLMFMFIWALINVPLYVIYRVTGGKKRECPACGSRVKVGVTTCGKCDFDFMKNATK
jgi:hypothetical protein